MPRPVPRLIVSIAGTTTLALSLLTGMPASAASVAQVNNCGTLVTKPTELVLTCADANQMLTELTWSGWSSGRATGSGRYEVNDCEPTCVAGTVRSYPVQVKLQAPKAQRGVRVFTKVAMTFTKKSPTGKKKVTRTLARYVPPAPVPTPEPSASPAPEAGANPSASPTPTPTPSGIASPTPTATPTVTPSTTPNPTAAVAPPVVTIESRRRVAGGSVEYIVSASSKARGSNSGIRSVTGYQANEYGAELSSRGTYLGVDYGAGTSWEITFSCAVNRGQEVRIDVRAADGQTTSIREKRAC